MSLSEVVVEGTIRLDGTLELDHKPNLGPGRVTVVLQRTSATILPQEDWWQFMQRSRKELEAAGSRFLNDEEITRHVEWLREGDRVDDLLQLAGQRKDSSGC